MLPARPFFKRRRPGREGLFTWPLPSRLRAPSYLDDCRPSELPSRPLRRRRADPGSAAAMIRVLVLVAHHQLFVFGSTCASLEKAPHLHLHLPIGPFSVKHHSQSAFGTLRASLVDKVSTVQLSETGWKVEAQGNPVTPKPGKREQQSVPCLSIFGSGQATRPPSPPGPVAHVIIGPSDDDDAMCRYTLSLTRYVGMQMILVGNAGLDRTFFS